MTAICFPNTLFFMNLEWLRYTSICFISSSRSSVLRAPFDFSIWISSSKSRRPRSMEEIFESWEWLEETGKDTQLDDLLTNHWSKTKADTCPINYLPLKFTHEVLREISVQLFIYECSDTHFSIFFGLTFQGKQEFSTERKHGSGQEHRVGWINKGTWRKVAFSKPAQTREI